MKNLSSLTISDIALIIANDWAKVNFAARPYLDAMFNLDSIKDMYYADTGRSVVLYFLNNASPWKGDTAKVVKAELKLRLKR